MRSIWRHLGARWPFWFGINARQALRLYLMMVGLMMFTLLMIALTIDMAKYLPSVRTKADDLNQPLINVLLPYLTYRSVDIVTRLLPMACFFGFFMAEIIRARRLESTILALSGMSPAKAIRPIILFALIIGAFEASLEIKLRPWAVFAQVDLGLGAYGRRFKPVLTKDPVWIVMGNRAIRARIKRGENPEMRNVELFSGINQNKLGTVLIAERATPTNTPKIWHFEGVTQWQYQEESAAYIIKRHPSLDIDLELIPEQLTYYKIDGRYLSNHDLLKISEMRDATTASAADVAIWRRWSVFLLPGAFAFLGASLAQIGASGRRFNIPLLLALALMGDLSIVSIKVLWALGGLSVLPASVAVLGSIIATVLLATAIQIGQSLPRVPRLRGRPKVPYSSINTE